MKILIRFTCILIWILFYCLIAKAEDLTSNGSITSMPLYYPEDTIGSRSPYFIWYDAYNERNNKDNVKYKITLKPEKGQEIKPALIIPNLYNKYYYYFKWPFPLEPDKYTFTIERLTDLKSSEVKYFHYLKYPVTGEFEIEDEKTIKDDLPPDKLIEYLTFEKENKLVNRYNLTFYSSASLGSFGIGLLFYKVLDFGIISKIIYYVAFTSSAVGIGAAGYYGFNYFYEKSRMQKIANIGKNVSIYGNVAYNAMRVDFKMSY
jgi:hypothetical protein